MCRSVGSVHAPIPGGRMRPPHDWDALRYLLGRLRALRGFLAVPHAAIPLPWKTYRMSARAARRSLDQRAITVAGALRFRPLADGVPEILAGAAGLQHAVRWVHSVEAPRVATLLH